ncbi:peptidase M61 [Antarcticibacterium flavum]|uniref:Peptidase M61 n=1 Tax=Antarcticibacterium flavum TaxID=2058175 RepID=A0A5B7WZG7_9FLAO|nr:MULTISPECIES: peptidase M61 [Antarcticibacterium]MCM4158734.1 peptidase M61 [Antarcticibacterium sp. W02-3]QCY68586.1 peptidase M61 [Antarcticibacterium flavum]
MKKLMYFLAVITVTYSCKTTQELEPSTPQQVEVKIDLVNVKDDRVMVTVDPGKFTTNQTTFYIPTTVPGTYSIDNYGTLIEDLKAYDYLGKELLLAKTDDNSWLIDNARDLDKITYWVNDSYDIEGEQGIFSPSGTNIMKNQNFMLNLHGFVGYFDELKEQPYKLIIERPQGLFPGTAMQLSRTMQEPTPSGSFTDTFNARRYFEIIDNPIMYAAADTTHIRTEGINVLLHVYSPGKVYTAQSIKPGIEQMITAQKRFLGDIDNTSNYAILLYLADSDNIDARGYGALEHHTSTVVVLPETMPLQALNKTMTDVVSHEFFHILTPLNVHSNEIHYFDYNDPKMSQHLWMYEGVTEYFAHLFQVNQGLIDNTEFYSRMADKIETSQNFDDTVPFTTMSRNILEEPYKNDYYNVYLKGALIGMALDIRLRELSNGEEGILDLMKDLSERYGKDRPFEDDELIPAIVEMTYPEIQEFFDTYISGSTPIPYEQFLEKVGIEKAESSINTSYFIKGQVPYIDGDPDTGDLFFRKNIALNSFLKELGVQNGDIIRSVNGTEYSIQNVYDLVMQSQAWQESEDISMVVERDGEETTLTGKVIQPTDSVTELKEMELPQDDPRVQLRKAWLLD